MSQSREKLWWATAPNYVGGFVLIAFFAAVALVLIFVGRGMINEAILVCLGALVLLVVGVIDLLAELIVIGQRIEKSLESKSH
jgi:hypothetical protein